MPWDSFGLLLWRPRRLVGVVGAAVVWTGCATGGLPREAVFRPAILDAVGGSTPLDFANSPDQSIAQLWARRSYIAGRWAVHPWFLVFDHGAGQWEQWEVWAGRQFGFYRKERPAKRYYSDGREPEPRQSAHVQTGCVRGWLERTHWSEERAGEPQEVVLGQWFGSDADALIEVLQEPTRYPNHGDYHYWPGPNSNSYPRWALSEAGLGLDLDPRMVGKDWYGTWGFGVGVSPTRTGFHVDLPLVGVTLGLDDGVELHLLGGTFGVDLWPPALKTPLGRLGFP